MEGNNRIFERVRSSLNQNNKKLPPEELEVVKCIFAALITGVAAGQFSDVYTTTSKIMRIGKELGLIKNSYRCD
jgi:hypothetical protein